MVYERVPEAFISTVYEELASRCNLTLEEEILKFFTIKTSSHNCGTKKYGHTNIENTF